jgi:hypothetical protein
MLYGNGAIGDNAMFVVIIYKVDSDIAKAGTPRCLSRCLEHRSLIKSSGIRIHGENDVTLA